EDKQRKARRFAKTFVPGSRLGVQLSYLTMKLMFTPLLARFIGKQFGFDSLLQAALTVNEWFVPSRCASVFRSASEIPKHRLKEEVPCCHRQNSFSEIDRVT